MKQLSKIFVLMVVLTTLLISACTGASVPTETFGSKVQAAPVQFTGIIEAMDGNQWTVNGQVITVDPAVLRDGPFLIGDVVKVEVQVQTDGSMLVTRVEAPDAEVNSSAANSNDVNSNDVNGNDANSNDVNSNDANSNDVNSNDANSNDNSNNNNDGLVFDDNGTEAFGTVDSITADTVVVGGQSFAIVNGTEFMGQIQAGSFVKLHFSLNPDGTMSITQIETWDPALVSSGNANDNNNDAANSNDDNGNDNNSNDDNGNDDSSNDNGSNNDQGGNDNGGDDSGGDSNDD